MSNPTPTDVLAALAVLDEYRNRRPHVYFRFIGHNHHPSWGDLGYALSELRFDALFHLYEQQVLPDAAINAARDWMLGMFAGVTRSAEDIRSASRDDVLKTMAVQGMLWSGERSRWSSPHDESLRAEYRAKYGSNWLRVWFGEIPEYDVEGHE